MKNSVRIVLFSFMGLYLLVAYQNCGNPEVSFEKLENSKEASSPPVGMPDLPGVLEPGEEKKECVEGKRMAVWLDDNSNSSLDNTDTYLGNFVSYNDLSITSVDNYNYFSDSAHPIVGPIPDSFQSKVFFFEGSDGLSMNFFFNVDGGGTDETEVDWDIQVAKNNLNDSVLLSDDKGEIKEVSSENAIKKYQARFWYSKNTDGGVIGPLSSEEFLISVKVLRSGDNRLATFYSADGKTFSLSGELGHNSFIIGFEGYEICN